MSNKEKMIYLNTPITQKDSDIIGLSVYAEKISDAIDEGAQMIAITSPFGSGKTSVIDLLREKRVENKKEYILKREIDWVKDLYDFILIDCPPSLNMLTVNAMTTANTVLVPIQCEYYALEGLSQLIHTVNLVKERLNPELYMEGVVFTMYDSRTNLSAQVVENVKQHFKQKVFDTVIPRNIRLAEAPSHGKPIMEHDNKCTGAKAYLALTEEFLSKQPKQKK